MRLAPEDISNKRILFSALDWGLGHVMRSIPLLKKLHNQGCSIFIACDIAQEKLFREELKEVVFLAHTGYSFKFRGKGSFSSDLFFQFPKLLNRLKKERKQVAYFVDTHQIDIVLSDQRMGFYSKTTTSILLTHQLNLPLSILQKPAQWFYTYWVNKFTTIWIPDLAPPNNLAGKLSETKKKNAIYIGWLSRFSKLNSRSNSKTYKIGVIVSGPAPYSDSFFVEMKQRLINQSDKSFIIYHKAEPLEVGQLSIFNCTATDEMQSLLLSAEKIITRAGYSSMMDLKVLDVPAEYIPTPGQSEQEYLVRR